MIFTRAKVVEGLELEAKVSKLLKRHANLVNMPNPNCELPVVFLVELLVCCANNVAFPKELLFLRRAV